MSGGLKFLTREFGWARASREVAERPVGTLTKLSSETWRLEINAPWLRPTCSKGWILDQNRVQGEGKYGRRALTSTKSNCEQGLVSVAVGQSSYQVIVPWQMLSAFATSFSAAAVTRSLDACFCLELYNILWGWCEFSSVSALKCKVLACMLTDQALSAAPAEVWKTTPGCSALYPLTAAPWSRLFDRFSFSKTWCIFFSPCVISYGIQSFPQYLAFVIRRICVKGLWEWRQSRCDPTHKTASYLTAVIVFCVNIQVIFGFFSFVASTQTCLIKH